MEPGRRIREAVARSARAELLLPMGNVWQRDERVLRWVFTESWRAGQRYDFEYETSPPQPVPELDGMLSTDLQTSLWRLHQYGLIQGDAPADPNCRACPADGRENAMVGKVSWSRLGPTASGLIALGEFPDLDRIMSAEGIRAVLDALATWASEEAASRLRTAAGLVGQLDDDVLQATMASVAASPRSMSLSPAMQSSNDAETVCEGRDLQVLQVFARPGTIDARGAFTLSDARLRELGVALAFDEMLQAIHALSDLDYVGGHGWVEGVPDVFPQGEPTEFPFESIEYRHFFVTGRGLRALGEWPSFTDLTPTTLAALLEWLADETVDQAQANETRAAAWDIRVLGPGILDVAVNVATAPVARQAPGL
jgi:hypothetical protein